MNSKPSFKLFLEQVKLGFIDIEPAAEKLEAQAREIEELKATVQRPDRSELQAEGKHPAPCAKFCEATAFGIDIRALKAENKQLRAALVEITNVIKAQYPVSIHTPMLIEKALTRCKEVLNVPN